MSIDIVNLIENNPITKLSGNYQTKLVEKVKNNFTNYEQQLFLSSFYCYLKYDSKNDFVIDLDNIWQWLGFGQKVNAKRVLEKQFTINKDYKLLLCQPEKQPNQPKGGHNKEIFMLNIETFKKFCLKSETKKADEVHDYFIKLENIMFEITQEECEELKTQLENNNKKITEIRLESEKDKQNAIEQTLINQFPANTECIYFGTINNSNEANEKLIKFGHTNNLSNRIVDHRKHYDNFTLIESFKVQNKVEIENLIKTHPIIKKQIRNILLNEKNKTEIIAYNTTNFTISQLTKYIKDIIHSKTYSIDNFNKLLKQNEDLLSENEELKNQLKICNERIRIQSLEINELKEKLNTQKNTLQLFETENVSVYQNPLLNEDEQTNKFNEFINTMCIVRLDVEESSTNMEGAYRIWNKIKPKKETFHAFKTYLDIRFKPSRISNQNKNQVVYGYIGVKLIQIEYKKLYTNNDVEIFLFQVCKFTPSGKILNSTLLSEYQRWKQQMDKSIDNDDLNKIKEYLNACEYALKATVWTDQGSNEGYYGISLKADEYKHKTTSSTGKKVEKIELKSEQVLSSWDTIAKAAEYENMSAAKMSRSIKNKTIFNNDYYYKVK